MSCPPIVIFTYKRFETLQLTIDALKKNYLAANSDLLLFSDAAKNIEDQPSISLVRNYLESVNGFKSVTIKKATVNKGLANSIIDGVTEVLKSYDTVIVLEDDLIASHNFLKFMNEALNYYASVPKVFSVSGYTFDMKIPPDYSYDVYFTKRSSSWGWATWKDRWNRIDWEVKDYLLFSKDRNAQRQFDKMGSDLTGMLKKQMTGKINSWAIRWCYHQFKYDLYTVFPLKSKITNIGFDRQATHTNQKYNRFTTVLDLTGQTDFNLPSQARMDSFFTKQFTAKYSLYQRIIYRIINQFFFL
jgi:hypothetical protein